LFRVCKNRARFEVLVPFATDVLLSHEWLLLNEKQTEPRRGLARFELRIKQLEQSEWLGPGY
jgi:hypothetical protein